MSYFIVKKKPSGQAKLTIILSKTVSKKATERNLLKRRIRSLLANRGLIVIVRRGADKLTYKELQKELYDSII